MAPDTPPAAGEAARGSICAGVDLIVTGRVVTMDARRTVLPGARCKI